MAENFTAKQREIVARKLGYDGPMQGFDDFLNSSPALGMKYATLSDKFATRMAKGGMVKPLVKKMNKGGFTSGFTDAQVASYIQNNALSGAGITQAAKAFNLDPAQIERAQGLLSSGDASVKAASTAYEAAVAGRPDLVAQNLATYNPATNTGALASSPAGITGTTTDTTAGETVTINGKPVTLAANYDQNYVNQLVREAAQAAGGTLSYADFTRAAGTLGIPTSMVQDALSTGVVTGAPTGTTTATGAPSTPTATTYTAAQTDMTAGMTPTAVQAGATQQAGVTQAAAPAPVSLPTPITAPTITAASAAGGVTDVLTGLDAQQGTVSDAAKIAAATQAPETTAVAGMEAAQGVAGTVQGAPTRTVQEGEMVSGPAVDMARAEEAMAKTQAAQGVVTEEMTVQGQLNKLLTDFDAGSPPPWAAASMRAANAQMAARGLGASSMAGQAIIQATLEAATPIAAADAKVFETMGLQNLSNRQQTAMLVGQQRAAFLGQEFDQAFQTRVLNAARVADIANKNFDAGTQIAIENSRLANSMDIANLSAKNAVVLGKMAQMSQLETQNLSNRQQAAVENAKAFLTMDIKNLDNRQQTALFRAQEMNDALISDAGFANAVNITNASNTLDAAKVSAQLALSAETFNADIFTKVNMANALAANEIGKFNAQQANAREEFNSNMANQINLANAKIIAEISTANTAATNAANAVNAKNATDLSAAAYAQQSQTYRDLLEMSWKTGESEKDRATNIVAATLSANASTNAATTTANSAALANIAKAGITLLANYDKTKASITSIVEDIFGP